MARTKGAKGKRTVGAVRVRDDLELVPINTQRMRALLADRPLLPLAKCGADRSQLRRLRDGEQASMRLGKLKRLAELLDVPIAELLVASGPGESGEAYRINVTARALAEDCWRAAGQAGEAPFWLSDMLRSLLNHDTWAGGFHDGETPVLSIDPARGGRGRRKVLARLEARRRQFCDLMAHLVRLMLPTAEDRKAGVRVNPRRAGALLMALRDGFLVRMVNVSHTGTAQTRRIAGEAGRSVLPSEPKA
jgi:hypothetical protein